MPIIYHETSREFHLFNGTTSYVIGELVNGHMGQIYYGKRLRDRESFAHLLETTSRPISSDPLTEHCFSMEFAKQEYPCFGTTDYREAAYEIQQTNGSHITDFVYESHKIYEGKPVLQDLPASYVEDAAEATTLEITMKDQLLNLKLILIYTIYEGRPVITRSVRFENEGQETVRLEKVMSLNVDFPDNKFDWIQFSGAWARERTPVVRSLEGSGVTAIESMRGHSSSQQNPFVILKRKNTTEFDGEAFGFSLVYSGNFLAMADVDTFNTTRFMMGINPRNFSWKLEPGCQFQAPEVIMVHTKDGLNALSGSYHSLLQNRVARGYWRNRPRPVLLNNWEATGMEFTEDSIVEIASKGAEVGVELFVLDDGWFGVRTEESGLGDWYVDKRKLPNGLKGLVDRVHDLGLRFGIWIEPEMVNPKSDLFEKHPEYALMTPDRRKSLGRNQMVLDFSNPAVVDCIYDQLMESFQGIELDYIKWDMNCSISECYSPYWGPDRQGEVYHRYILGVYRLYEKMIERFPNMLFESCASGGCRFDAGMLYYAPQAWCSDDTDAIERIHIQYGSSYGYPISSWGAHVSEVPNQQAGRITPLKTRANVAYFGAFGYEMDLNELSPEEIETVKEQVKFMKQYRELIQFGSFYRLSSPWESNIASWMVVSPDKKEALVGVYLLKTDVNCGFTQLKLQGLASELDYKVDGDLVFGGDELMEYGLIPLIAAAHPKQNEYPYSRPMDLCGDFDSKIFVLKAE
ncbi:MAG: alpha-galactosidase [Lachnospiraceae bacterium]|nr:alpha-galactosidase [Lachnospiraceae bacterium]